MKVFISWSGENSHAVAVVLRDWLPSVLQHVEPWVSSEDIDKGSVWLAQLGKALENSGFGILCLVPDNLHAPWIAFEAGAMSREFDTARVSPILVGLDRSQIQGPLALFQSTVVDQKDMRKLVRSINKASANPIAEDRLNRTFKACWPELAQQLGALAKAADTSVAPTAVAAPIQDDLPKNQVDVLVYIALNESSQIGEIAAKTGQNPIKTEYHIDRLTDAGLVTASYVMGGGTYHYVTNSGRAYVVERDLV